MTTKKIKKEMKTDGRCIVAVFDKKGDCYQVALTPDMQNSIIFIIPQLFDDHKIKILPKKLPISLPKRTK